MKMQRPAIAGPVCLAGGRSRLNRYSVTRRPSSKPPYVPIALIDRELQALAPSGGCSRTLARFECVRSLLVSERPHEPQSVAVPRSYSSARRSGGVRLSSLQLPVGRWACSGNACRFKVERMIDEKFGSKRGLVRLGLSYVQVAARAAAVVRPPDPAEVTRFVFVCQGNICRSAFAEAVAARRGFRTASFGLSTSGGQPADPVAIETARLLRYDLTGHRTTTSVDFVPAPGDLFLAMEVRQMHRLAGERFGDRPRLLLGSWAGTPHLHDPFSLGADYMRTCLMRIERAVEGLISAFPGAALCGQPTRDRRKTGPDRAS